MGHGTFPNRPMANWITPMAIALSTKIRKIRLNLVANIEVNRLFYL
jgi:hypothetical protein